MSAAVSLRTAVPAAALVARIWTLTGTNTGPGGTGRAIRTIGSGHEP